jgi:hypothetical protein
MQFNPIWDKSGEVVGYVTIANFSDNAVFVHSLTHTKNLARIGVIMYGVSYAHPGGLYHQYKDDQQSPEEMQAKNGIVVITVVIIVLMVVLTAVLVTGLLAILFRRRNTCGQQHNTARTIILECLLRC